MTITEFIQNIKLASSELIANREAESIQVAREVMAQVRLRVQTDNVDANGNTFGRYSQAVVPQWMYYGKSLSQGAEAKLKKGKWMTSYEDFRDYNNLQTDAKDFTFSGEMWRNTGVVRVENTTNVTTVVLGGTTQRSQELIGYHTEREGVNIIAPNEQEVNFAVEAHRERVFKVLNKYFR